MSGTSTHPDVRWFTKASEPGAPVVGDYVIVLRLATPGYAGAERWEEPGVIIRVRSDDRLVASVAGMQCTGHVRHREAPESLQLQDPHGQPVEVWMCGACKGWAHGSKALADSCCRPVKCDSCDKPIDLRGNLMCSACQSAERAARDARRFELAAKVFIDDYRGVMVAIDGEDDLVCIDHLDEWISEEKLKQGDDYTPLRVYATQPTQHYLDSDDAIENALDEAFADAHELVDSEAKAELKTYMLAWSEANLPETYYEDSSIALVPWPVMYSAETCARLLGVKKTKVLKTMVHLGLVPKACEASEHMSLVDGFVQFDSQLLALIRRELTSRGGLAKPRDNS